MNRTQLELLTTIAQQHPRSLDDKTNLEWLEAGGFVMKVGNFYWQTRKGKEALFANGLNFLACAEEITPPEFSVSAFDRISLKKQGEPVPEWPDLTFILRNPFFQYCLVCQKKIVCEDCPTHAKLVLISGRIALIAKDKNVLVNGELPKHGVVFLTFDETITTCGDTEHVFEFDLEHIHDEVEMPPSGLWLMLKQFK